MRIRNTDRNISILFQVNSEAQVEADRRLARRLVQLMFWPARMSSILPPKQETIFSRPQEASQHEEDRPEAADSVSIAAANPFDSSLIIQKAMSSRSATSDQKDQQRGAEDLGTSYPNLSSVVSLYSNSPGVASSPAMGSPLRMNSPHVVSTTAFRAAAALGASPLRTYGNRKRKDSATPIAGSTPAKQPALQPPSLAPGMQFLQQHSPLSTLPPRVSFPVPLAIRGMTAQPSRLVLVPAAQPLAGSSGPLRCMPASSSFGPQPVGGLIPEWSAVSNSGGRLSLAPAAPSQHREIIHVFSLPAAAAPTPTSGHQQVVHRLELSTDNPLTKQLGSLQ